MASIRKPKWPALAKSEKPGAEIFESYQRKRNGIWRKQWRAAHLRAPLNSVAGGCCRAAGIGSVTLAYHWRAAGAGAAAHGVGSRDKREVIIIEENREYSKSAQRAYQ